MFTIRVTVMHSLYFQTSPRELAMRSFPAVLSLTVKSSASTRTAAAHSTISYSGVDIRVNTRFRSENRPLLRRFVPIRSTREAHNDRGQFPAPASRFSLLRPDCEDSVGSGVVLVSQSVCRGINLEGAIAEFQDFIPDVVPRS